MNSEYYRSADAHTPRSMARSHLDGAPAHSATSPIPYAIRKGAHLSASLDHPTATTPKPGSMRCYSSLLSADLSFLYVDPVLASDLEEHGDLLLGRSLFDFVHPKELATARNDLGNVLGTRELHGSITRVPFANLSGIRRLLAYPASVDHRLDRDRAVDEDEYALVDIVVNWAAEGVVLCFLHFVPDDTASGTPCGTSGMSVEQSHFMYQRLLSSVAQPDNVSRVFQLLWNTPERQLLVSWPPDRNQGLSSKDFVKIAQQVNIGSTDATTTACIRRYKAMRTYGDGAVAPIEVESVFIPHGTVIFACHKVKFHSGEARDKTTPAPYATSAYADQAYYHPEQYPSSSLPPIQDYDSYHYSHPHAQAQYDYGQWSGQSVSSQPSPYPSWASQEQTPSPSQPRTPGYASSTVYLPYSDDSAVPPRRHRRSPSPYARYSDARTESGTASPTSSETVAGGKVPRRLSPPNPRETYNGNGRSSGLPPVGIPECSICKATSSPEWRKGPSGKKDLCNACGLRFARSRAKKDGAAGSQRRKKSSASLRDDPLSSDIPVYLRDVPSAATTPDMPKDEPLSEMLPGLRRGSADASAPAPYPSSPASRPAGAAYAYGYTGPGMHARTPSPSPPASALHFSNSNYSYRAPGGAQGDLRYAGSNGAYYDHALLGAPPALALPRLSPLAQYAAGDRQLPARPPMSGTPSAVAAFERRIDDAR